MCSVQNETAITSVSTVTAVTNVTIITNVTTIISAFTTGFLSYVSFFVCCILSVTL